MGTRETAEVSIRVTFLKTRIVERLKESEAERIQKAAKILQQPPKQHAFLWSKEQRFGQVHLVHFDLSAATEIAIERHLQGHQSSAMMRATAQKRESARRMALNSLPPPEPKQLPERPRPKSLPQVPQPPPAAPAESQPTAGVPHHSGAGEQPKKPDVAEKKRRKLYEQGEVEHPLTHLKLSILLAIAECWILTTEQVVAFMGMTDQAARNHLLDLFDLGLVRRFGIPHLVEKEEVKDLPDYGPATRSFWPTRLAYGMCGSGWSG